MCMRNVLHMWDICMRIYRYIDRHVDHWYLKMWKVCHKNDANCRIVSQNVENVYHVISHNYDPISKAVLIFRALFLHFVQIPPSFSGDCTEKMRPKNNDSELQTKAGACFSVVFPWFSIQEMQNLPLFGDFGGFLLTKCAENDTGTPGRPRLVRL